VSGAPSPGLVATVSQLRPEAPPPSDAAVAGPAPAAGAAREPKRDPAGESRPASQPPQRVHDVAGRLPGGSGRGAGWGSPPVGSGSVMPGVKSGAPPAPARGAVPPMVWVAAGALGVVGVLTVLFASGVAVVGFSLLGGGDIGFAFGALALLVAAVPLEIGVVSIYAGWRLRAGDRVARICAVVITVGLAVALLLGSEGRLLVIALGLCSAGLAASLMFEPSTRAYFTGSAAAQGGEPDPVVAARLLMALVAGAVLLVGLGFLALSVVRGVFLLYGGMEIGIAVCVFVMSRRLSQGDGSARVYTTGLAVVYALIGLIVGEGAIGVLLAGTISVSVLALLWLPESSQIYFARLNTEREPLRLVGALDSSLNRVAAVLRTSGPATSGTGNPDGRM